MEFPRKKPSSLRPHKDDLEFQILDWFIPESDKAARELQKINGYNNDETDVPEYDIYMYGVTANGDSVCAHVTGFEPYFFVKAPPKWTADKLAYELKEGTKYNARMRYNCRIIPKKFLSHLVSVKAVKRKDFWGFTNNKEFTFYKITTKSLALFNILTRYFRDIATEGWKLYESNIDPFLRFIHERDIRPCGWVRLPARSYELLDPDTDAFARTSYSVRVVHDDVVSIDVNKIAPLLIASFDLECTSSHGDFPVPKKDYRKLAMDLVRAARASSSNFGSDALWNWILGAFKGHVLTPEGIDIHQVYPKQKVTQKTLAPKVETILDDAVQLIQTIVVAKGGAACAGDAVDDNEDVPETIDNSETMELETRLVALLTNALPPLEGDPIIQIGTTVHIYGSDKIVYRHIATLRSCEQIEGADVECFEKESDLLLAWKDLIVRLDPDILTGYNIFGFDMSYVWSRAKEVDILEDLAVGFGRLKERQTMLLEQRLSSSALGDNILNYVDLDGIVLIDMFKVMQRDHKLDSYKLDNVASVFLGDNKEDLKPKDIFRKFGGTAEDRRDIATYCLQDCALCNRLLHKLKVLENNVGMGNVCSVPLSYLFMRGQGVKIFSLVAKECRTKDFLIPVIRGFNPSFEDADTDGYEGAIVLEPKEGIYLDTPITVLDYSSLYPSSMIARNLSHDCYVNDEAYAHMEDEGITYETVTYDVYEGVGDKKRCVGKKECTYAQLPNGKKGIIPSILQHLLTQRKNTRKKIEYERVYLSDGRIAQGLVTKEHDDGTLEMLNVDNANVCEGFGGCKATIPGALVERREPAFSTFEQAVLDALQLAYKITANSLYGQIGSRTSPIYWKDIAACTTATGREMIMTAKNFVEEKYDAEVVYGDSVPGDTPILLKDMKGIVHVKTIDTLSDEWIEYENFRPWDPARTDKEQAGFEGYVWSNGKWARIARVIRHKVNKRMFRVNTFQGCVDVTEDHSIVNKDGKPVKPLECIPHSTKILHSFPTFDDIAVSHDISKDEAWEMGLNFAKDQGTRSLMALSSILNSSLDVKQWFVQGCIVGSTSMNQFECTGKIAAMGLYTILRMIGHDKVRVNTRKDNDNIYTIRTCVDDAYFDRECDHVFSVTELPCTHGEYVYDIETSEGNFAAGVGNIVCFNTDSIFVKFPNRDDNGNAVTGKDALPLAIAAGQRASKEIKSILPPPQCLEYEKTFYPFILFSKKRYVGNLYEDDATKKPKQKSMGIVLKRRDNANIVKKVYGGIIDIILNQQDLHGSVHFLQEQLQALVDGNVDIQDLIITKTLRAEYKDPTKIAHKVLADRMAARDPGNKPAANDRIPFVYIRPPAGVEVKLQGDRIEHPDHIKEHKIQPDYRFYITNQLINPIAQLYALCVEKLPNYTYSPGYWNQIEEELMTKELYRDSDRKRKDRLTALRMRQVEELLFNPYTDQMEGAVVARKRAATTKKAAAASSAVTLTNPFRITIHVVENKSKKCYECTATLMDGETCVETFTEDIEKKKKTATKQFCLRQMAEIVCKSIYTRPDIKLRGINFELNDSVFIRNWKNAILKAEEHREALETAIKNQDIGEFNSLQEQFVFQNLVNMGASVPYILTSKK